MNGANETHTAVESDLNLIGELNRRGFQVMVTRHITSGPLIRYYCRIRSQEIDQTFSGLTSALALATAFESLS